MNDEPDRMSDQTRQEWSRHYDNLHWGVIGIFSAGVGALIGLSFQTATIWPEISGLLLIFSGVFYVAGFRAYRFRLHRDIQNRAVREFLMAPGPRGLPHMWDVFVLSFVLMAGALVYRFANKLEHPRLFTVCGWAFVLVVLGYLWYRGKSR